MSLEDRARHAAREADRAKAREIEEREGRYAAEAAQAASDALDAWVERMQFADCTVAELVFHEPDTAWGHHLTSPDDTPWSPGFGAGGGPQRPPRFEATVTSEGHVFDAVYELNARYGPRVGRLDVKYQGYHMSSLPDFGKALAAAEGEQRERRAASVAAPTSTVAEIRRVMPRCARSRGTSPRTLRPG